jgi:type II secretory pathway component PulC
MIPAPAKIQGSRESKESAIPSSGKKAGRDIFHKEPNLVPEMTKKSAEPATRVSVAPQPSLKLSGIIWQEEPGERRAMISGRIATEGSIIEGVKVVEILPTRVRFSHNGKYFEISLGQ